LTRFLIALIIAITVLCWIFVGIFIRKSKTDDHRAYTIYKCLASLCFVLIALLSVIIKGSSSFGILVLFGLCFGFLGDLLLALRFHCEKNSRRFHLYFGIGSCSFLIGHFLYILALFRVSDHFLWIALLYTAIGMILSEWYASKNQVSPGSRIAKAGGTFYVAAVVFMGGCALGAAIKNPCPGLWIFALGGLSFVFSDNLLIANYFGKNSSPQKRDLLHILYWIAQLLISFSILFMP